jgi:hypothetical protein
MNGPTTNPLRQIAPLSKTYLFGEFGRAAAGEGGSFTEPAILSLKKVCAMWLHS